ncbi:MAG: ATP-binding cassette domain-containing protein [Bacteroidetes bacterium]|jgi:ATP-binding cassette subfamily F protein 3|nr:ATP-binding cassette domain-containing protein [Bacteroidota bacterium]
MINANNIFVKYGDRLLLDYVSFVIAERDKVGLVGRNGAGKSTLLKIIAGHMSPHDGKVVRPSHSTLGFLHQEMTLPKGKTVINETLTAFDEVRQLEKRIAEMNEEMATRTDYESDSYTQLLEEFSEANERFQLLGGQTMEADAERVLTGLGFKPSDMERLTDEFSGGWQMRIELAKMLLQRPDYLLLDEPTNHLDIESIIWLERFLRDYQGAVIVISHDKEFLNNVTTRTVEVELGKVFDYKAPYKDFVALREERREKQRQAYENQQRVIAEKERTINRFMAKANKTKMAQSMQKQLDKMERIEVDDADTAAMHLRFPPAPRSGQVVMEAKDLTKKYGELLVLNKVDLKLDRGDRVAFVGQNGQGKTTLAKIIVNNLTLTEGELQLGHNVQIGYYAQNQSDSLHAKLTVLETMEAAAPAELRTQVRNILGAFMFSGEDVEKKVSVLSGGERARLALACLLLHPFNLLVLDEPTNHLDIISKEALQDYDGTLIVVSHDREFLAGLTNRTIEFRDRKLHDHIGDVNAFLKKRELDNMRAVEMTPSTNKNTKTSNGKAEAPPKKELSYEERKRMQRAINKAEKRVGKLEEEIEALETRMADPEFYQSEEAAEVTKQHAQKQQELEEAIEEWEMAQLELMEYE